MGHCYECTMILVVDLTSLLLGMKVMINDITT